MENIEKYSDEIIERVSSFFQMCLSLDAVPIDLLEEKIAWSEPFMELERGNVNPFLSGTVGDLYKDVFHSSELPNQYVSSSCDYWIGDSYARIFLECKVSFFRISLLLPIKEMADLFLPYHEMDPEQIVDLYKRREKECSVLERLKSKSGLSFAKIIKKTGISKSNIFRLKNNEALNRISLNDANKLSLIFSCPTRTFLNYLGF